MQAGESGQADYTIEGLKEGTHEVDFDITAVLDGLPIGRENPGSGFTYWWYTGINKRR